MEGAQGGSVLLSYSPPSVSPLPTSLRLLERLHGASNAPALVVALKDSDRYGAHEEQTRACEGGFCTGLHILWANTAAKNYAKQMDVDGVSKDCALSVLLGSDSTLYGSVHRQLGHLRPGSLCAAPASLTHHRYKLPQPSNSCTWKPEQELCEVSFMPCFLEPDDSAALAHHATASRCCLPWPIRRASVHRGGMINPEPRSHSSDNAGLSAPVAALLLHFTPAQSVSLDAPMPTTPLPVGSRTQRAPSMVAPSESQHPPTNRLSAISAVSAVGHVSNQAARETMIRGTMDREGVTEMDESSAAAHFAEALSDVDLSEEWWRRSCLVLSALPVSVTVFGRDDGHVLFQNAASIEFFGDRCRAAAVADPHDTDQLQHALSNVTQITTTATAASAMPRPAASRGLLFRLLSLGGSIKRKCKSRSRKFLTASSMSVATAAPSTRGGGGDNGGVGGRRGSWTLPPRAASAPAPRRSGNTGGAWGSGSGTAGTLQELFALEPGKLLQLMAATAAEGGVWQGIVRVPKSLNPEPADSAGVPSTLTVAAVQEDAAATTPHGERESETDVVATESYSREGQGEGPSSGAGVNDPSPLLDACLPNLLLLNSLSRKTPSLRHTQSNLNTLNSYSASQPFQLGAAEAFTCSEGQLQSAGRMCGAGTGAPAVAATSAAATSLGEPRSAAIQQGMQGVGAGSAAGSRVSTGTGTGGWPARTFQSFTAGVRRFSAVWGPAVGGSIKPQSGGASRPSEAEAEEGKDAPLRTAARRTASVTVGSAGSALSALLGITSRAASVTASGGKGGTIAAVSLGIATRRTASFTAATALEGGMMRRAGAGTIEGGSVRGGVAAGSMVQQQLSLPSQRPNSNRLQLQLGHKRRSSSFSQKQWSSVNTLTTSTWQVAFDPAGLPLSCANQSSLIAANASNASDSTAGVSTAASLGLLLIAGGSGAADGRRSQPTITVATAAVAATTATHLPNGGGLKAATYSGFRGTAMRNAYSLDILPPVRGVGTQSSASGEPTAAQQTAAAEQPCDWNVGGGGVDASGANHHLPFNLRDPCTDKLMALPSEVHIAAACSSLDGPGGGGGGGDESCPGRFSNAGGVPLATTFVRSNTATLARSLSTSNRSYGSPTGAASRCSSMNANLTAALASHAAVQDRTGCGPSAADAAAPPAVASRVVAFAASLRTAPVLPKASGSNSGGRSVASQESLRGRSERRLLAPFVLAEALRSVPGPRSASMSATAGGAAVPRAAAAAATSRGGRPFRSGGAAFLAARYTAAIDGRSEDAGGDDNAKAHVADSGCADHRALRLCHAVSNCAGSEGGLGSDSMGFHGMSGSTATLGVAGESAHEAELTFASKAAPGNAFRTLNRHGSKTGSEGRSGAAGNGRMTTAAHNARCSLASYMGFGESAAPSDVEDTAQGNEAEDEGARSGRPAVDGTSGALTRSSEGGVEAAAEPPEMSECWHEVVASCVALTHGSSSAAAPRLALVLMQRDVSAKVVAERHVARVSETEHRLLEQIFPRHVLQYIMEDAGCGNNPAQLDTSTSDGLTVQLQSQQQWSSQQQQQQLASFSRVPSSLGCSPPVNWRPHIRDCNRLATWHPKVTVLFADIQGFTPMCKVLPPSVVMTFLNTLFTHFDAMLDEYGVYKVETIGDCYMVAGGLIREDEDGMAAVQGGGQVDPDQAANVVGFAKAMLSAASRVLLPTSGEPVRVRVGVHCGPVVSGVVGTRMPRFCLFGDTVNTASRMESTGVPGAVHTSEECYEMLRQRDPAAAEGWEPTGGIEVKGKGLMRTYIYTPTPPPSSSQPAASATPTCMAGVSNGGARSASNDAASPAPASCVAPVLAATATATVATNTPVVQPPPPHASAHAVATAEAAVQMAGSESTTPKPVQTPSSYLSAQIQQEHHFARPQTSLNSASRLAAVAVAVTAAAAESAGSSVRGGGGSSDGCATFQPAQAAPDADTDTSPQLPVLGNAWKPFVAAVQARQKDAEATGSIGGGSGCGGLAGMGMVVLPPSNIAAVLANGGVVNSTVTSGLLHGNNAVDDGGAIIVGGDEAVGGGGVEVCSDCDVAGGDDGGSGSAVVHGQVVPQRRGAAAASAVSRLSRYAS